MANLLTTSGKPIDRTAPEYITLYAPDGSEHLCAPVDAREILASGAGYSDTPPIQANEQQPKQQPFAGDIAGEEAQSEEGEKPVEARKETPITGETIVTEALDAVERMTRRRRKAGG